MTSKFISIRGAREHNLKNIDLDIPRDTLIVITGLSGSGKSSLAFDTIYAEGQRRYVESLSAYARQFLEMMQKPDVDHIDGLSPAISIEQKTTSRNPRSTVGTVTEIYDYMRLLFARVGIPYSPATGLPIESQTVSQMVDRMLALPEGTRLYLLAPIVRGRKGEYRKELAELQKKGFQRAQDRRQVLRDRRRARARQEAQARHRGRGRPHRGRATCARLRFVETACASDGIAVRSPTAPRARPSWWRTGYAELAVEKDKRRRTQKRIIFSAKFACPVSGFTIPEIEPRLFSFNNPHGACPDCDGLGTELYLRRRAGGAGRTLTLTRRRHRAVGASPSSPYYLQTLEALARHYKFSHDTSRGKTLPKKVQQRHPLRLRRRRDQVHL